MTDAHDAETTAWAKANLAEARELMLLFEALLIEGNVPVPCAMFALTHCMGRVLAASSMDDAHLQGGIDITKNKLDDIAKRYFKTRQTQEMKIKTAGATQ